MKMRTNFACMFLIIAFVTESFSAATIQKREDFSADPHWESFSTRKTPAEWPRVVQSFGWSSNQFPNTTASGQIGGLISRSTIPASYARVITTGRPLRSDLPRRR
jgi:hypothetical protein